MDRPTTFWWIATLALTLTASSSRAQWDADDDVSTAGAVRRLDAAIREGTPLTRRSRRSRRLVAPSARQVDTTAAGMTPGSDCSGQVVNVVDDSPMGPLAFDDLGVLEAEGCFPEGTLFEWTVGGDATIVGAGARVNLETGASSPLVVQVCAAGLATHCFSRTFALEPARPRVALDAIGVVIPYSNGNIWRIEGTMHHAPPGSELRLFKHSDVHYLDSATPIVDAAGHFAFEAFALYSVDRFVVELLEDVPLDSLPRCTSSWCRGQVDGATGHHVPVVPDGTAAHAFLTAYLDHPGDHPDPHLDALIDLMGPETIGVSGELVRNSWESDLRFLYGQALAVIALDAGGERVRAERILDALTSLQLSDGSWYFAYRGDGSSPFPGEGDFRYSGAVAWAALAFARHRRQFGTDRYDTTLTAVLGYLRQHTRTQPGSEGLIFNPTDLAHTSWDESQLIAFEHNADALAAYRIASDLDLYDQASLLEPVLLSRWNGQYFRPGYHVLQGESTVEVYLDTQTWGLMALSAEEALDHAAGLVDSCRRFSDSTGVSGRNAGIAGLYDFDLVTNTHPHGQFAWAEGTFGAALALEHMTALQGTTWNCGSESASSLRMEMESLAVDGLPGAVLEATRSPDSPYRTIPTLAATAWAYLAAEHINPFR